MRSGEIKKCLPGLVPQNSGILKLVFFWFSVYIHQAVQENICWYSDLVISTEYVGPLAGETPAPQSCDFNLDGSFNMADVVLLLMKRDDPQDERADYNRDGCSTIADVLQMLIDQGK